VAFLAVFVGGGAWAAEPKGTQPGAAGTERGQKEGVIDPRADAALHQMSYYLAKQRSFRMDMRTVDEKVTTDGVKVQEIQDQEVAIQRPNEIRVDRVSPRGHTTLRDDGKQVSIFNQDKNVYATTPASGSLDTTIDEVSQKLGIDAPASDLVRTDAYQTLTDGLQSGHYVGLEPIGGVKAHHIVLKKKNVDLQLWIKEGSDAVPLRYVITSKDMPGAPQFSVDLERFQPNASIPRDTFSFSPPSDARRVEFAMPKEKR
jgi:hypothetical protein